MDLRHRGEIQAEAGIGRDQHFDIAAELARQHGALHIAAGQRRDRGIRGAGLDLVLRDFFLGVVAKCRAVEPPAAACERRAVEFAESDIVGDAHAADAGVFERLFRQQRHLVAPHFLAVGVIDIAGHPDFAALGLTLTGQHLDQLALAVAGNAGDADDFPAADGERNVMNRDRAGVVERVQFAQLEPRFTHIPHTRRLNGELFGADHHPRHAVRREIGNLAVAGQLAAAKNRDLVGECHHLAEFMRDHQDSQAVIDDHAPQHAEHLVGFARGQHRGRLVEDQEAPLQVKLLEDFAFLPLTGGNVGDPEIERHLERHARQKRLQFLLFFGPVDHGRDVVARQHQVLRHRHRAHQGKMLVHHAESERVSVLRIGDRLLAAADQHVALGRVIIAHDTFDERALAGAVFAEQRMERTGPHLQLDIIECREIAEPHGHGDGIDAKRPARQRRLADDHDRAPISAPEVATAPNTPPCILIIFRAWS